MPRILIVEDDRKVAAFLEVGLREEAFDVAVAPDGETGLELASGGGFDIILLDRMLPRMSGLTLLTELRRGGNQVPVLMLSAREADSDVTAALEAGASDYLAKPFRFHELLDRIRAVLG